MWMHDTGFWLCCFRKLVFFDCFYARFLLLQVEPHYFDQVLFDVLQNFYDFTVNFAANTFALPKQPSHGFNLVIIA